MGKATTEGTQLVKTEKGVKLVIDRVFGAPRERVFRAFVDPEQFADWFGPKKGSVPHCTVDAREGGVMHFCVRVPDDSDTFGGQEVWGKWVFEEFVPHEKLVMRDSFSDPEGNTVEVPGYPLQTRVTITFDEHGRGTRMILVHEGLEQDRGEVQGWTESLDSLATFVDR